MEYYSELADETFVTNEENQIQNDVPPTAWVVITEEDQGIVEYITDGFSTPTNTDNQ